MNSFIVAGICAGAFFYGGLRTLTRVHKGTKMPVGDTKAMGNEVQEVLPASSEPLSPVSEVSQMVEEADIGAEAVENTDDQIAAADLDSEEATPESALSIPLSEGKQKHWFLIKSKDGKVRVCQAWEKTPKTIAGPFSTKEEATRAKES